ncbi:hypothetical protein Q3O60_06495 [Alkalimonas collagenimarina]|uniref:Uncharacterized protein n=1 Tax=Alkalimonas collagenimarina TaxID=400390 RepID=A0ABT9GXP6_9GAMM|nr:hypothetical protein [Alkalimonas collagenimarina]MDP4535829.1 hypothetical protein [Alkalimonas collagenimarina]
MMFVRSPRQRRSNHQQRALDAYILQLHHAIAIKLLSQPELIKQCEEQLVQLYHTKQIRHGAYVYWDSVLRLYPEEEAFIAAITDSGPKASKYRRKTPCSGILTEHERQQLMASNAKPHHKSDFHE